DAPLERPCVHDAVRAGRDVGPREGLAARGLLRECRRGPVQHQQEGERGKDGARHGRLRADSTTVCGAVRTSIARTSTSSSREKNSKPSRTTLMKTGSPSRAWMRVRSMENSPSVVVLRLVHAG